MDKNSPIVMGADHFGLPLKDAIRDYLVKKGYQVVDLGVNASTPVDYPDVGALVAEEVGAGKYERGILVCGTGAGMAIVANKVPGVRAVCVQDPYTAERAVASNNAQMVIAAGSVMKEPRTGPIVRIATHHAAGVAPPAAATRLSACSANPMTGRVAASAMMTTTNIGSV